MLVGLCIRTSVCSLYQLSNCF